MVEDDLNDVLRIESQSFPRPWSRELYENELGNEISHCFVQKATLEGCERVVGYVVFWIVVGEAHILTIAVDPELRGRGFARALMSFILDYIDECEVAEITLEVRRSNYAAKKLYEDLGFTDAYVRKNYYGDEDAIVMRKELRSVVREQD